MHRAYLIVGESAEAREKAFQAIEAATVDAEWSALSVNTFDGEQATGHEIIDTLRTVPFMGGTRLVYVRRFDRLAVDDQALIADSCNPGVPGAILVLSAEAIDRRRKGMQAMLESVAVVDCAPPHGDALVTWVIEQAKDQQLTMRRDAAVALVNQVGERADSLVHELGKLRSFLGQGSTVSVDDVAAVATVGRAEAAQNEIFLLCDAVAEGRVQAILLGLDKLFGTGANPIYIVTMLARHYRRLLAVKTHGGRNPLVLDKELGLRSPKFATERLLRQATALKTGEIEEALALLLRADMSLKRSAAGRSTVESVALRLALLVSA